MNPRTLASSSAAPRAQPDSRGQPTPESSATYRLARTLVAQAHADHEYESETYDADFEFDEDFSEGWPDSWEDTESDPASPYGDVPPQGTFPFAPPQPVLTFFGDSSSARSLKFEIEPPIPWLERLAEDWSP
ncbi:MAG: hypothetical protein OXN95_01510, partial [bacterium]|nr:hypothetical protein [bacterium]